MQTPKEKYEQLRQELEQWNRTRLGEKDLIEIVHYLAGRVVEERERADGLKEELTTTRRQLGAAKARNKKAEKREAEENE